MRNTVKVKRPGSALVGKSPVARSTQQAMLDASADCIKLLTADGRLLHMNRAGCEALGVPDGSAFGMTWLDLLPQVTRPAGHAALRQAATGQAARFPGISEGPDGRRHWDNLLTPLAEPDSPVRLILCVSRDVTHQVELEQALQRAAEEQRLLTLEMQHRVKNLFFLVSGLINMVRRDAIPAEERLGVLQQRLDALGRASDATLTPALAHDVAREGLSLGPLVAAVLAPYGARCRGEGPDVLLLEKSMTPVALMLHEFATNSVKHGSLGTDGGRVTVGWTVAGDSLRLRWTETGGPPMAGDPMRRGFGSELVERMVATSGGRLLRQWPEEGLVAELVLPHAVQATA